MVISMIILLALKSALLSRVLQVLYETPFSMSAIVLQLKNKIT